MHPDFNRRNILLILVAALGYFVDIYDLVLFSVIRVQSLKGIGIPDADLLKEGVFLLNMQMFGMLLGGILWGVLGDKKGRVNVLFGSIIMYSLANIANGFVSDINTYGMVRLIAGIGLAGELGAGITLVSESMSKETRGYGTMAVAGIGLLGAVVAALVGGSFQWQTAFFVGGGMGLVLLLLRIGVFESGMFNKIKTAEIHKGNFLMLFSSAQRFKKYINCILIAIPVWFVVGILITFAPEFGTAMNIATPLSAGKAIMFAYIGISIGDFFTGFLSQFIRSRKRVILYFLTLTFLFILIYLFSRGISEFMYYLICALLGFSTGFWAVFVTVASEQFGTNLRATVTTTVPNFVRGSVVPVTLLFQSLKNSLGIINSALIVGTLCMLIAYGALYHLEETYGKELDYTE